MAAGHLPEDARSARIFRRLCLANCETGFRWRDAPPSNIMSR